MKAPPPNESQAVCGTDVRNRRHLSVRSNDMPDKIYALRSLIAVSMSAITSAFGFAPTLPFCAGVALAVQAYRNVAGLHVGGPMTSRLNQPHLSGRFQSGSRFRGWCG